MESNLPCAANHLSDHYEYRFGLNIHSNMCENLMFRNEEKIYQYEQFENSLTNGSLFFNKQIFSPYSDISNVDNNERIFIQPSSLDRYQGISHVEQPYLCNQMSETLSTSCIFDDYKSIYNGTGGHPCIETGSILNRDSNLMNHQSTQSLENHYTRKRGSNVLYQSPNLITHESICTGEEDYKFSECRSIFNQSSDLTQHQNGHT